MIYVNEYLKPITSEEDLDIYEKFLEEDSTEKNYKIHCFINNKTSVVFGKILNFENKFVKVNSKGKILYINSDRVKYIEEI